MSTTEVLSASALDKDVTANAFLAFTPYEKSADCMEMVMRFHFDSVREGMYRCVMLSRELESARDCNSAIYAVGWFVEHQIAQLATYAKCYSSLRSAMYYDNYQTLEAAFLEASRKCRLLAERAGGIPLPAKILDNSALYGAAAEHVTREDHISGEAVR